MLTIIAEISHLHVHSMNISSLLGTHCDLLLDLLGDLAHQTHLVQRKLFLPGGALHDRGEEGLRIEEAGEPDRAGGVEVSHPGLQLLDPEQQVCVP